MIMILFADVHSSTCMQTGNRDVGGGSSLSLIYKHKLSGYTQDNMSHSHCTLKSDLSWICNQPLSLSPAHLCLSDYKYISYLRTHILSTPTLSIHESVDLSSTSLSICTSLLTSADSPERNFKGRLMENKRKKIAYSFNLEKFSVIFFFFLNQTFT